MPKLFRFRFSDVLPTFCRPSKHTSSDLPSDPFLSFLHHAADDFNWTKSQNWHVLDADLPRRKIYNSAAASDDEDEEEDKARVVSLPPPRGKRRSRISKKSKKSVRLSVSSTDSGLFSDDEQRVFETLVSNSTDSSADFSPHLETIRECSAIRPKKQRKTKKRRVKKVKIGGRRSSGEEEYAAARLSAVFRRLGPRAALAQAGVEGKMRESMAVVKRSEEPYEDFKKSMVEMIVEKEMVEEKDLQELLRCFLSLNSEQHHGIIIRAFDDIIMSEPGLFFTSPICH